MSKLAAFILLGIVAAAGAGFFLRPSDPRTSAKLKCEFGIEEATGLSVGLTDVSKATVTGDELNGTVQMQFAAGSTSYLAECIFEHGKFRRVMLNGKIIAGR